jgi:hypothetical protein
LSQLFHPRSNNFSRASIVLVMVFGGALLFALGAFQTTPYVTQVGVIREQPVPFSHQHHVAGLGIDCRYCHHYVEKSASAGIPSQSICMNCHSVMWNDSPMLAPIREAYKTGAPVEWSKVHDVPDFVYFNHSIHVKKGIGCASCHGQVDKMQLMYKENTLQMGWCLNCHRNPEQFVRPREEITSMDWKAPDQQKLGKQLVKDYHIQSKTDCYACHR